MKIVVSQIVHGTGVGVRVGWAFDMPEPRSALARGADHGRRRFEVTRSSGRHSFQRQSPTTVKPAQ